MGDESKPIIRFCDRHTFELKDRLRHELYEWPDTLLTYRLDFSGDRVFADRLALFDSATDEQVPFQLSTVQLAGDGSLASAQLSFIAGLGSGEERRFMLAKERPQPFPEAVKVRQERDGQWIDNGRFAVKLPQPQLYPLPQQVPGPIMQMESDGRRYGGSRIESGSLDVVEITVDCRERGPCFAEYAVVYAFDEGKRYEAVLTFISGMEFVRFAERIERITEHERVSFRLNWSGLAPTHRHAPNNPAMMAGDYSTPYADFNWDAIDERHAGGMNHPVGMWSNGSDGEIPFRLSLYEPQASIVKVNAAAFWNEGTGQSVGAFILEAADWDNGRYDLFCSWDGFAVRFYYNDGLLWWHYPLIEGTRITAIAMYDHQKDVDYFERVRPKRPPEAQYLAGGTRQPIHGVSYCIYLQIRHSLLSLDRIKDYVLEYPEEAARCEVVFADCPYPDYASFESFLMNYVLVTSLPTYGQRVNAGFSPVPYRRMVGFTAAYNRFRDEMPFEARKRIEAMLLLLAYLAAGEEVVPLLRMHGGPPNLQGDVKRALGYTVVQFPEHPEAERWKELFAKFVETSLRLYTRPDLEGLRLTGGRWAENLGTYTWAFLIPALKTAMLLEERTGMRNIFADRYAALLGKWLVHSLTAPFAGETAESFAEMGDSNHYWGCFPEGSGQHRVYLPIGAHAARRTPPCSMREFARRLERYDPLLAEQLHYVCANLDDDFEKRKKSLPIRLLSEADKRRHGTRPDFRTTAFTGFGIMLRSGVYTNSEVSVFLQQIDGGPNYRWGTAGAGGNGNLYYYAGGKAYSHNGKEDAGDRRLNDCEVGCNFGVWKNNKFTSIGQNVIMNGCRSLGTFQFAAIESERDELSYSYPEYVERNALLSGTDYISVYDVTGTPAIRNRFTWSVHSTDRMPAIHLLNGYKYSGKLTTSDGSCTVDCLWYEGQGDSFAIVSHREDLSVEKRPYGAVVSAADFRDTLLRSGSGLKGEYEGIVFEGTAAAIRETSSGDVEAALIRGRRLRAAGVELYTESGRTGIGVRRLPDGTWSGTISAMDVDRIRAVCVGDSEEAGDIAVYVNAVLCEPDEDGLYRIVAGEHTLQLLPHGEAPVPDKPSIRWAVYGDGQCELHIQPASGADRYRVQLSVDHGDTWHTASETGERVCMLQGLENGRKYMLRVCGVNDSKSGAYSHDYPLYPSAEKPLSPEGLEAVIRGSEVELSWGRVLGAGSYRLYKQGANGESVLIYSGAENRCRFQKESGEGISRYAVSAVNLCGEGETGPFETSDDPSELRNIKPLIDRPFNRNSYYNHHPFRAQNTHQYRVVPSVYPESVQ